MYQENNIIKYNNTNKQFQVVIISDQVLMSSMENLKWIMIGKLKNEKIWKKKIWETPEENYFVR